jgi:DNA-binding NarL/FixJ family response regulator
MSQTSESLAQLDTIREPPSNVRHQPISEGNHTSASVTSQTSTAGLFVSIALIDEYWLTRECIIRSLKQLDHNIQVTSFAGCEDYLGNMNNYEVILYYVHRKDQWRTAFESLSTNAPVIILSDFDSPDAIIDALENGVRGYIPIACTAPELLIQIIRLVRAGGTFAPVDSLCLRKTDQQGVMPTAIVHDLTPRQLEVLHQLKFGKANKLIAYELEMSESTVKVHIRNIMRKMNAKNRTEVACRAHGLTSIGPHLAGQRYQIDVQPNI